MSLIITHHKEEMGFFLSLDNFSKFYPFHDLIRGGYLILEDIFLYDGKDYHLDFFMSRNFMKSVCYYDNGDGIAHYVDLNTFEIGYLSDYLFYFFGDHKNIDYSSFQFDTKSAYVMNRLYNIVSLQDYLNGIDNKLSGVMGEFSSISGQIDSLSNELDGVHSGLSGEINGISLQLTDHYNSLTNLIGSMDFSSLENFATQKFSDLMSYLDQKFQSISVSFSNDNLLDYSLDGAYGSYRDGSLVAVVGFEGVQFEVKGSFLFKNDDKSYMIGYKLSDVNDPERVLYIPSIFVSSV